jgi:hypothetical protein
MTDLLEMILAARKKGGGWIVPIIFVVIYIVSALGKLKRGGGEEDIEFEKRPSLRDTEGKFRYKSLDDSSARQRPAAPSAVPTQPRQPIRPQPAARRPQPTVKPRPARVPSHLRPQVPSVRSGPIRPAARAPASRPHPKQRRVKPKAAPRAVQKPRQPQKTAAAVVKPPAEVVHKPRALRSDLSGSSNLQRAIIYSEILGKPLALRDM